MISLFMIKNEKCFREVESKLEEALNLLALEWENDSALSFLLNWPNKWPQNSKNITESMYVCNLLISGLSHILLTHAALYSVLDIITRLLHLRYQNCFLKAAYQ